MLPELEAAASNWQRVTDYLVALVGAVDADEWQRPSPYPGWSNKDLLIHLAEGYVVRIGWLESIIATGQPGERVDIDAANAARIAARRDASIEDLVSELRKTRAHVLELMEQLQPHHLAAEIERSGSPPYLQRLDEFLRRDLNSHDLEHAADLKKSTGAMVVAPEMES